MVSFWVLDRIFLSLFISLEIDWGTVTTTGNHSPYFAPVLEPSLTIASDCYVVAALACLLTNLSSSSSSSSNPPPSS